jgi:hypothetical protein
MWLNMQDMFVTDFMQQLLQLELFISRSVHKQLPQPSMVQGNKLHNIIMHMRIMQIPLQVMHIL